jgi:[ribosomal protein S18]-alanine N-acetyltransferase
MTFGGVSRFQVSEMVGRDHAAVLAIEALSFNRPFDRAGLIEVLARPGAISLVARLDMKVVGFLLCEVNGGSIILTDIAVIPSFRRRGVGRRLIIALLNRPGCERLEIHTVVSDAKTEAHLFFRDVGFLAVEVVHECGAAGADGYHFVYR